MFSFSVITSSNYARAGQQQPHQSLRGRCHNKSIPYLYAEHVASSMTFDYLRLL